jgi:1-acyl-sn-glycerol-3-phosphate acyltransferase
LPKPIHQVQPPLEFVPPAFNPLVYQLAKAVFPFWTRWRVKLVDIQVSNVETLAAFYRQFQAQEARFMLAFRHPSTNDPFCLFHLLNRALPQVARQQGIHLKLPTHAHFMYDRGIPLWAGAQVGWLLQNLGCTPIRRGKLDLMGLRSARQLFAEGRFPVAAAPEGATNGHNDVVSPIEPGIAQLGFWCVEDLLKANRSETVWILPVGIQYFYVSPPWDKLEQLLTQLEADSGLPPGSRISDPGTEYTARLKSALRDPAQIELYQRLLRLGEHLLTAMEQYYSKFYHQSLKGEPKLDLKPEAPDATGAASSTAELASLSNAAIAQRLQALMNAALTVSEQYFGVPSKGNVADRCRRLEQAGWDWIFREDLKQLERLSPVERGLANRIAEEASMRLWHMRLVESFVSVTGHYVLEKPTVDRFAEMLLLIYDTVNKIKGRSYAPRPKLGLQRAQVTIGEPISVSDRWADYKTNRRSAVSGLTQELQEALEQMIR